MSRWLDAFRKVENTEDAPVQLGLKGAVSSNYDLSAPNGPNCTGASNRNQALDGETEPGSLQAVRQLATPVDGCPDEWNEGVSRLISQPCPHDFLPARWRTLQADAARFLEMWAAQAARLGWTVHDLFGVNQVKPLVRLDGAGLVWLLDGRPVIALTADEAVLECRTGSRQAYRRKPANPVSKVERALLWEINDG